ncbi:hypothetical protein [Arcticibacter eurypsychrophilus]
MSKAYHYNANRMWIFNVGNLKTAKDGKPVYWQSTKNYIQHRQTDRNNI